MSESDTPPPRLSVVVPAYREEDRLGATLDRLAAHLEGRGEPWEILVVDDGSDDDTAGVVARRAAAEPRLRLESYRPNRGKGYAVRRGLELARGELVFFTDADLSTPPEEIDRAVERLADHDVVAGSRARPDSDIVVRQGAHREGMGRTFNRIVRWLGLTTLPDTQCGFKGFRRSVLPDLLPRLTTDGFAFDVELLYEAERLGLRIAEQPVQWTNDPRSQVRLVRDSLGMLWQVLRLALRRRRS